MSDMSYPCQGDPAYQEIIKYQATVSEENNMGDFTLTTVFADGSTSEDVCSGTSVIDKIQTKLTQQMSEPVDNGRVTFVVTDNRKGKR
jgi:hypothetical protein